MKKIQYRSLTMRIWATFTAVILIIILSISALYLLVFRRIDQNAKVQDLKVAHDILLKSNDFSKPLNRFEDMRNLRGSNYFIFNIGDDNKTQIIDVNRGQGQDHQLQQAPPPMLKAGDDSAKMWMASFINSDSMYEKEFIKSYNKTEFIFIISSIKYGSSGKSYLISYMPNMQDNSLLYLVAAIGAIFIAIGFITAKVVANRISKPLKELEKYTRKIAHKDWNEPIPVKSRDEIGSLAESMNHMQNELKRADEEEKMFLQSISHDLKTPVMVIMSHAEAIIDGVFIDSPAKTAEIIRDEAVSLDKKIKQILYLNTLDYVMENDTENIELNLHELVLNIINRFEMVNSEVEWELDMEDVAVHGNPDRIRVSIENIVDNALRYAAEKIRITLKREENFAVLDIYNDGPNIDQKHIGRIFDKMYKDKTGNFGLGLTISKKIIDFYKGTIEAVNREKGVSFIVKLPI